MKPENRGYDPETFTVSTKRSEFALIPNVGRFCLCGCGKEIRGKKITGSIYGKKFSYIRQPKFNQKFATLYCGKKYANAHDKQQSRSSLLARIPLAATNNMREITVYIRGKESRRVAITKSDKSIWNLMESLQRKSKQ